MLFSGRPCVRYAFVCLCCFLCTVAGSLSADGATPSTGAVPSPLRQGLRNAEHGGARRLRRSEAGEPTPRGTALCRWFAFHIQEGFGWLPERIGTIHSWVCIITKRVLRPPSAWLRSYPLPVRLRLVILRFHRLEWIRSRWPTRLLVPSLPLLLAK